MECGKVVEGERKEGLLRKTSCVLYVIQYYFDGGVSLDINANRADHVYRAESVDDISVMSYEAEGHVRD